MVFIDEPANDVALEINTPEKVAETRQNSQLEIQLKDADGAPLQGDFSVGIVSANASASEVTGMKSWLLLNSDLKGAVKDPDYFFQDHSKERKNLLDALMLTHGWRRFVWKDLLREEKLREPSITPERGIMVSGKTTRFNRENNARSALVTISLFGDGEIVQEKTTAKENGFFEFGPYFFQDTLEVLVEALDTIRKGDFKQKYLSVLLDDQTSTTWLPPRAIQNAKNSMVSPQRFDNFLKTSYESKVNDFKFDPAEVTVLDEVVVTDKRKSRTQKINDYYKANMTYSEQMGSKRSIPIVFRVAMPSVP